MSRQHVFRYSSRDATDRDIIARVALSLRFDAKEIDAERVVERAHARAIDADACRWIRECSATVIGNDETHELCRVFFNFFFFASRRGDVRVSGDTYGDGTREKVTKWQRYPWRGVGGCGG
jgi:hypothetical protein